MKHFHRKPHEQPDLRAIMHARERLKATQIRIFTALFMLVSCCVFIFLKAGSISFILSSFELWFRGRSHRKTAKSISTVIIIQWEKSNECNAISRKKMPCGISIMMRTEKHHKNEIDKRVWFKCVCCFQLFILILENLETIFNF